MAGWLHDLIHWPTIIAAITVFHTASPDYVTKYSSPQKGEQFMIWDGTGVGIWVS